jgi:hypothetical protein
MASNVIETNIIAVANDPEHDSGEDCHVACYRFLYSIVQNKQRVLMDADDQIFQEYRRYAHLKGQPRIGDMFLKWLHDNRGFENIYETVEIEDLELPQSVQDFDLSDHKFVKVAIGTPNKPVSIFNATDSDWLFFEKTEPAQFLNQHQISIQQLCRDCLKAV